MRVDDDVARQANKDTESNKDEVELILDRDYVQIWRRRIRVTYLRHFVPSLLFQDVTSRAQLALSRFESCYGICPLFPLGTPFTFQLTLRSFQCFSSCSPSFFSFFLFSLYRLIGKTLFLMFSFFFNINLNV